METGLYCFGLRSYSPELGRWIRRDPIEEKGGINLYQFIGNNSINLTDYLGINEIIISGGCNPTYHGWEYEFPGVKNPILEYGYVAARHIWSSIAHDRLWRNFVDAAHQEIVRRKEILGGGEFIEWHVEMTSYQKRAVNEGMDENYYINIITQIAIQEGVNLRFFATNEELANNINMTVSGNPRMYNEKIWHWKYFGHGEAGALMTKYRDPEGYFSFEDIIDLKRGAFVDWAVTTSCGCNTATPNDDNISFSDVWKAHFDFELYSVRGKVDYWDRNNIQPESGAKWVPNAPPAPTVIDHNFAEYIISIAPISNSR